MKKIFFKTLFLLMLFGALSLLTGCFSYRDVEELNIAAGAAVDLTEEGQYELSTELVNISSGAGSQQKIESLIVESTGKTISDAVNNSVRKVRQKVYWSNAQIFVISEEAARKGIAPLLDWLIRDHEPRLNVFLAVAKQRTAKSLLKPKSLGTELHSFEMAEILENSDINLGETAVYRLYEVVDTIGEEGHSATIPALEIGMNQGTEKVQLAGTAVFKEDKLIGYLNGFESKTFNMILNKIDTGTLTVTFPTERSNEPNLTVEIYEMKASFKPAMTDEGIMIQIKTTGKVAINNNDTGLVAQKDTVKKFEKLIEQTERKQMLDFIHNVQQNFGADIFGFGQKIHQTMPRYWRQHKKDWDAEFKTLPVTADCDITIVRNGLWRDSVEGD